MITVSVDDKIASARLISDMMKKLDPDGTHEEEKDPEKALERIVRLHPDIVWLDIEMSGMNGLELAAEIKKKSPFTNIVFVTGHPEYAIDGFSLHVSGFVLKPVTEAKLLNEIVNLRRPVFINHDAPIRVQCFGSFEVFDREDRPVHFSRTMSKEAFAYLINKRGAGVSVAELCAVLWEERYAESGLKAQCRVLLRNLKMDPRQQEVLDTFVRFGAPEDILVLGRPHIGTDRLPGVVRGIREEIIRLGGRVRFGARLSGIVTRHGALTAIRWQEGERTFEEPVDALITAIGHSAEDTQKMLFDAGVDMRQKPFSAGFRIEHPQEMIDLGCTPSACAPAARWSRRPPKRGACASTA